jgi:hypothetical protein
MRSFRTACTFLAILFWFSSSAFSLFEIQLSRRNDADSLFWGRTLPLFVEPSDGPVLEAAVGVESLSMMRDTLTLSGVPGGFSFTLDTVYLPGFIEYDELGIPTSELPIAATAGAEWRGKLFGPIHFGLEVYAGGETASTNWGQFLYGATASVGIARLGPFSCELRITLPEQTVSDFTMTAEADAGYEIGAFQIAAGAGWDGNASSCRFRVVYQPFPSFSASAGFSLNPEYGGFEFGAALRFCKIKLFGGQMDIITATTFALTGDMDFSAAVSVPLFDTGSKQVIPVDR